MMCLHPECSTWPHATANPLKLTASANFFPLSMVTHNNTRSQKNMEIHNYDAATVFCSFYTYRPRPVDIYKHTNKLTENTYYLYLLFYVLLPL